jgi:hypothetical protein
MNVWAGTQSARNTVRNHLIRAVRDLHNSKLDRALIEGRSNSFERGDGVDAAGNVNFYRTRLDVRLWAYEF